MCSTNCCLGSFMLSGSFTSWFLGHRGRVRIGGLEWITCRFPAVWLRGGVFQAPAVQDKSHAWKDQLHFRYCGKPFQQEPACVLYPLPLGSLKPCHPCALFSLVSVDKHFFELNALYMTNTGSWREEFWSHQHADVIQSYGTN